MIDYIQPSFYRFNQDSIRLIEFIKKRVQACETILDLGAGSGILGIELANHFKSKELNLLELQESFLSSLKSNVKIMLNSSTISEIHIGSFQDWKESLKFDLIVCNPPYYLPGHGKNSSNQERQLARTFDKDGWEILLNLVHRVMGASAFFVIKNDKRILSEVEKYAQDQLKLHFDNDLVFLELSCLQEK